MTININLEPLRKGQKRALKTIMDRVRDREPYTAVVLPTRYGKSDVIRLAAYLLKEEGHISTTIMLSPNLPLKYQVISEGKLDEMKLRYGGPIDFTYSYPANPEVRKMGRDGEHLISLTTQIVAERIIVLEKWAESYMYKTGKPILIFVDECHTGTNINVWGNTVKRLVDIGAVAALCTATAFRDDREKIIGFDYDAVYEGAVEYKTYTDIEDDMVRVDTKTGQKYILKLRAHHETTFEEGWREIPCPLCHISRVPFDIKVRVYKNGEAKETKLLSRLSRLEVRENLGKIVRHKETIKEGCKRLAYELEDRRKTDPDAAAIVFCANDEKYEAVNAHAKQILKEIKKNNKSFETAIITTSIEEGKEDEDAHKRLNDFIQKGKGDILIVKSMAGVGIDCARLKVVLDLSPVRTSVAYIQRIMRAATPYGNLPHFALITPDDILGRRCFDNLIKNQGGEAQITDIELIDSEIRPKEENNKNVVDLIPESTLDADFNDTKENKALFHEQAKVRRIRKSLHEVVSHMTDAEISLKFAELEFTSEFKDGDTTQQSQRLVSSIQSYAEAEAGRRIKVNRVDFGINFEEYVKVVLGEWAKACGFVGQKLTNRPLEELLPMNEYAIRIQNDTKAKVSYISRSKGRTSHRDARA